LLLVWPRLTHEDFADKAEMEIMDIIIALPATIGEITVGVGEITEGTTEEIKPDKHSSLVDIWPPPTIMQLAKPPFLDTPKTVMLPQDCLIMLSMTLLTAPLLMPAMLDQVVSVLEPVILP